MDLFMDSNKDNKDLTPFDALSATDKQSQKDFKQRVEEEIRKMSENEEGV